MTRPAYLVAAAATAAAMVTAACGATTSVTVTNGSPRPLVSRPIHEVTVYTAGVPAEPFVEVAIIQARDTGSSGMAPLPALIGDMRVQAAGLGCDALLVYGGNNPIATDPQRPVSRVNDGLWGSCIVYSTPQPAPPAPIASPLPTLAAQPVLAPVAAPAAPAVAAAPVAVAPVAVAPVAAAPVAPPAVAPVLAPAAPFHAPGPVAAWPGPAATDSVLVRMFHRLDRDRNGVLTPAEIPPASRDRLLRHDTSGDGWITRAEIDAAGAAKGPERTHAWGRRRR